jgi:hypothetical protein
MFEIDDRMAFVPLEDESGRVLDVDIYEELLDLVHRSTAQSAEDIKSLCHRHLLSKRTGRSAA